MCAARNILIKSAIYICNMDFLYPSNIKILLSLDFNSTHQRQVITFLVHQLINRDYTVLTWRHTGLLLASRHHPVANCYIVHIVLRELPQRKGTPEGETWLRWAVANWSNLGLRNEDKEPTPQWLRLISLKLWQCLSIDFIPEKRKLILFDFNVRNR